MFWILVLAVCAASVHSQSHSVSVSKSRWGTSSASSGHGASVARDPYGSSRVSSDFAGSASGTSGQALAMGSNQYGHTASQSVKGTAAGTAGKAASAVKDIYGHEGSASSKLDGSASNTAGMGSAMAENAIDSYVNDMFGTPGTGYMSEFFDMPVPYNGLIMPKAGKGRSLLTYPEHGRAYSKIVGGNLVADVTGLGGETVGYIVGDELGTGVVGFKPRFEPLDWKVQRIIGEAVPHRYEAPPSPFLGSTTSSVSHGGTATSSSGKAAAAANEAEGGSLSSSNYGGSASGTSGFAEAAGSNRYGHTVSGSMYGIATGTSGDAASSSHDIWGRKGSSSSYHGGASSGSAGTGSSHASNYGEYYGVPIVEGWPFGEVRYRDPNFLGGSHSIAMDGGSATGASDTGSSSAVAPGVITSAGVGSAGSAAGKRGASASAGGVSAAAARRSHKNRPNIYRPIILPYLPINYPPHYIALRR